MSPTKAEFKLVESSPGKNGKKRAAGPAPVQRKRRPRQLTERRKVLIKKFVLEDRRNYGQNGEIGSLTWNTALLASLNDPPRMGLIPEDVTHWIKTDIGYFHKIVRAAELVYPPPESSSEPSGSTGSGSSSAPDSDGDGGDEHESTQRTLNDADAPSDNIPGTEESQDSASVPLVQVTIKKEELRDEDERQPGPISGNLVPVTIPKDEEDVPMIPDYVINGLQQPYLTLSDLGVESPVWPPLLLSPPRPTSPEPLDLSVMADHPGPLMSQHSQTRNYTNAMCPDFNSTDPLHHILASINWHDIPEPLQNYLRNMVYAGDTHNALFYFVEKGSLPPTLQSLNALSNATQKLIDRIRQVSEFGPILDSCEHLAKCLQIMSGMPQHLYKIA